MKTYEWKCDHCGQKLLTQGFDAENSRPEEFGVQSVRNCGSTNYTKEVDVCRGCWEKVPEKEVFRAPAILKLALRAS
jgi:hypothetical protein